MAIGVLAEPRVLVRWGQGDRVQPLDRVAVRDSLVAVVIGPVPAHALARVARLRVAAVPQHGGLWVHPRDLLLVETTLTYPCEIL